jgi:hypothetical protein
MTARAKIEWLEENKIPPVLLEKERVRANSYSPTIVLKDNIINPFGTAIFVLFQFGVL